MDFLSIGEALDFQKKCPFCHARLKIRSKSANSKSETLPKVKGNQIIFSSGSSKISLSKKTSIEPYQSAISRWKFICLDCEECFQYYHKIGIKLRATDNALIHCHLESIWVKRIIDNCEYTLNLFPEKECILTKLKFQNPYPETEDMFEWNEQTINLPHDI